MKELATTLGQNRKVAKVKKELTPSLDDEENIKRITAIISTDKSLFDWAKSIYIEPTETKDKFNVSLLMNDDPKTTLLAEIYAKHKTADWIKPKYGHDKPMIHLLVDTLTIQKIINWYYSKIN